MVPFIYIASRFHQCECYFRDAHKCRDKQASAVSGKALDDAISRRLSLIQVFPHADHAQPHGQAAGAHDVDTGMTLAFSPRDDRLFIIVIRLCRRPPGLHARLMRSGR